MPHVYCKESEYSLHPRAFLLLPPFLLPHHVTSCSSDHAICSQVASSCCKPIARTQRAPKFCSQQFSRTCSPFFLPPCLLPLVCRRAPLVVVNTFKRSAFGTDRNHSLLWTQGKKTPMFYWNTWQIEPAHICWLPLWALQEFVPLCVCVFVLTAETCDISPLTQQPGHVEVGGEYATRMYCIYEVKSRDSDVFLWTQFYAKVVKVPYWISDSVSWHINFNNYLKLITLCA